MLGVSRRGVRGGAWPVLLFGMFLCVLGIPAVTQAAEGGTADVPLLRQLPAVGDGLQEATPFIRDTKLNLHLRTYYFYQQNTNGPFNQAWTGGACPRWAAHRC